MLSLVGLSFALDEDVVGVLAKPFLEFSVLYDALFFWFAFLFALRYVIGHVLDPVSTWFRKHVTRRLMSADFEVLAKEVDQNKSHYPKRVRDFLISELGDTATDEQPKRKMAEYDSIMYIWADWLRIEDAAVGARLVKLRAEKVLHDRLNATVDGSWNKLDFELEY